MNKRTIIQGEVTGTNKILYQGSQIRCWTNAMQAAIAPQLLILSEFALLVEVSGILHGDILVAWLERVISEEEKTKIKDKVVAKIGLFFHGRKAKSAIIFERSAIGLFLLEVL